MPSKRKAAAKSAGGDMPDDEKWRLINDSGILKNIPRADQVPKNDEDSTPALDATLLTTPFIFLYLLMDILIHQQYGQVPSFLEESGRMITAIPVLGFFIYQTNQYKATKWVQALLFILGAVCGSRLVYILNKSSWLVVIRQSPPLATVWVYTIVQLRLGLAVVSLAAVYGFLWWKNLKLVL
ncbi:hypothetical protein BKA62DRAFT_690646 [Auriculariales sp. MPI-PUGE-AT-0066]|nr:hypothetical protein BKA62DRAFT_690646 [Auriculariales sp. MPI-PUGE-AT-0066]